MVNRFAFTLIELIFAIVIIAISVVSLPMMNQVIGGSMEKNLAQEAIFSAVAEINVATSYAWDENSLLDASTGIDELSRVIRTGTVGDCALTGSFDPDGITRIIRRVGHVNRRCLHNLLALPYINVGTGYTDSLEASGHNYSSTINVNSTAAITSATGYKKAYDSMLNVVRCDSGACVDFGDANNINMKEITVIIRDSSDNNVTTLLRAYSANIGEVPYHRRIL